MQVLSWHIMAFYIKRTYWWCLVESFQSTTKKTPFRKPQNTILFSHCSMKGSHFQDLRLLKKNNRPMWLLISSKDQGWSGNWEIQDSLWLASPFQADFFFLNRPWFLYMDYLQMTEYESWVDFFPHMRHCDRHCRVSITEAPYCDHLAIMSKSNCLFTVRVCDIEDTSTVPKFVNLT